MEPISISWILEQIGGWFDRLLARKGRLDEREHAAVSAFLKALTETQIYLGRIKEDHELIRREEEENLSRLWSMAAHEVRRIDPILAQHCLAKGEHWATAREWREFLPETERANIQISAMRAHARELLNA